MPQSDHIRELKLGASRWNAFILERPLLQPDFRGANLTHSCLRGYNLDSADFRSAILRYVDFTGARLVDANLRDADLTGACLRGTILYRTALDGADLSRAELGNTILANVSLAATKGIETITVTSPCSIGLDTFCRSDGHLPESILTTTCVPPAYFRQAASYRRRIPFFRTCFLSHASADSDFVLALGNRLRWEGVPLYEAPRDMEHGADFRTQIDREIRCRQSVIVVLSAHALDSSWVEKEMLTALALQKPRRTDRLLIPVLVDSAALKMTEGWPADICRKYNWCDFRDWRDPDLFRAGVANLLKSLVLPRVRPVPKQ